MKRDLQINYGILDNIIEQLHTYKNALNKMESSLEKINSFIAHNQGESIEAWEDQVRGIKRDIKNYRTQVKDLTNLFENYVERTTTHIAPLSRNAMMRVDRNDISWNLDSIDNAVTGTMYGLIGHADRAPFPRFFEDISDSEKEKSQANKAKLEGIKSKLKHSETRLKNKVEKLWRIHETKVIKFENTDDDFHNKALNVNMKYTSFLDGISDTFEKGWEVLSGLVKGLAVAVAGLVTGVLVLAKDGIVVSLSSQIPDAVEPDFLKEEANATIDKYKKAAMQAIKDPGGILEAIGQSFSDTYEKEGIAYLTGAALPSLVPVAGVAGKISKVGKLAGKAPASKTKGFSGNIKAKVDDLVGKGNTFEGFKTRVSGAVSSTTSQFTKAIKAPFSNKFVQRALNKARSDLAEIGRALGGLKVPVAIEKRALATDFGQINTYGLKTKNLNDQFPQFAKVVDRVEGSGGKGEVAKGAGKSNLTNDIYKVTSKDVQQAIKGYEQTGKFTAHFKGFEVKAQRSLSHLSDKQLKFLFKKGYSPKDGANDTVILHHHVQKVEGPIIEMPSRYHDLGNKRQHPFGNKGGVGKGEERQQFDKWRKEYWKARYANELIKRGIIE